VHPPYITKESIQKFIENSLQEDVGPGDYSSIATIPGKAKGRVVLTAKQSGIIAGVFLASEIFKFLDEELQVEHFVNDGDKIRSGQSVLTVAGNAVAILTCERLVLNCMQRMSGVATYTNHLKKLIEGTKAQLLDTRKTTPNFRMMEKWAVKIGGGENHRMGLYDMIMLKDNHIDFAGGISRAIKKAKKFISEFDEALKIEIEARSLQEVREILNAGGVDIIMLDNMSAGSIREAVDLISGRCLTEASGGITEKNIREIAETGVNFISVGALTHSFKSLDLSLKVTN